MNALKLPALLVLGALTTARLCAGFESFKIIPTIKPPLSPVMQMEGVTEGKVLIAISVSAEGKLTDSLVLGYTHPALVRPCMEVLKDWTYIPGKLDGRPVAVQADVTIDYSAQGVVISRTTVEDLDQRAQRIFGYRLVSNRRSANELDAAPKPVSTVAPKYAREAEKDGVRGTVQVHFYIDETGAVRMPAVEGIAHPYLSELAVEAIREWRFAPPTSRGKPVLIAARQNFSFNSGN